MNRRASNLARAFTLIELILVLVLVSTMAAIVVPTMVRFTTAQGLGDSTDQVVALARWARTQAMAQGVNYRLNFDPVGRTYWLTTQKGATYENALQNGQAQGLTQGQSQTPIAFDELKEEPGRRFVVADGVTFTSTVLPQPDGQYIEFRSSGRNDQGTLTFTDSTKRVIEIGALSATEPFHVLSDNERQSEISQPVPTPPAQSR